MSLLGNLQKLQNNKITNKEASLKHMFYKFNTGHVTRHIYFNNINVLEIHTEKVKKSYSFREPNCWNRPTVDVRNFKYKAAFKTALIRLICWEQNHPG